MQAGPDLFLKNGEVQDEWKDLGGQSVAIPGLLKTMEDMLKRFGTMTLKEVSVPAIRYAKEGFGTSYTGALTMYDDSVKRKMRISEDVYKRQALEAWAAAEVLGVRALEAMEAAEALEVWAAEEVWVAEEAMEAAEALEALAVGEAMEEENSPEQPLTKHWIEEGCS